MEESASAACMVAESAVVKNNAKEMKYTSKEELEATLEMNTQSDVLGSEKNVEEVEKAVVEEKKEEEGAAKEKAMVEEEEKKRVVEDEKAMKEGLELEEQDNGVENEEELNEGLAGIR